MLDIIVNHLAETQYNDLPVDIVTETKKQILDTLAVTIAGGSCSISSEINGFIDLVKEWGGKEESTIMSFGGKVPAPNAALVNGTLAVRLDFDDTQVNIVHYHPSRSIIPTAFAVAESKGNVSGKELITAVALGHDLQIRLKQAVGRDLDSAIGITTDYLGASATAAKIINHNKEKMKYSLGLAIFQTSAGALVYNTSLKGVSTGLACRGGIIAAQLADKGFIIDSDFLNPKTKRNLYDVFYNGLYWPWLLTMDLGKIYMGLFTCQKQFPCCHGQHSSIQATLNLLRDHDINASDIDQVILHVSPFYDYALLCEPIEMKQNPANSIESQFSLPWGIASTIVYGETGIRNFSKEAISEIRIQEIARKIFPQPQKNLREESGIAHNIVEIKTKNGKTHKGQVDHLIGTPYKPWNIDDVANKFKYCCGYSIKPIYLSNQEAVIEIVRHLENVNDVGQIMKLLTG